MNKFMKWIKEYSGFNYQREVDSDLMEEINCVLEELSDKDFNFGSSFISADSGGIKVIIFKSKINHSNGSTIFKLSEVYPEVIRIIRIMSSFGFSLNDINLKLFAEYWLKKAYPNWKLRYKNPDDWDEKILDCGVLNLTMLFMD